MDIGVCRFNNIDNVTCYMNSILAIIQQMPIFADILLSNKNNSEGPIFTQLCKLIYMSHTKNDMLLNPISFRREISIKNSMWGMREQQDSQEFLSFLLSSIEEELKEKVIFIPGRKFTMGKKENMWCGARIYDTIQKIHMNIIKQKTMHHEYSIIKKIFGGMVHNMIRCNYCNNVSHNYDSFLTLQLNVCNTIYDSMDDFSKEEQIDINNIILCDFCGVKNKAHKKTVISNMPEILVIHFKRFRVNNYGVVTRKNSSLIKYPINLDITKYGEGGNGKYKLFGVNMHHSIGRRDNTNYGHYTSIVMNRNNNKWYHYDDDKDLEEVNCIEQNNAYLLFYCKE